MRCIHDVLETKTVLSPIYRIHTWESDDIDLLSRCGILEQILLGLIGRDYSVRVNIEFC